MKLDAVTVVPFPDSAAWAVFYEKFFGPLVNSLNRAYGLADREDAVGEAFYKLMFKKDRDAYAKVPETESDWFHALRWQARAELSHRRERDERHAKYVEEAAKALAKTRIHKDFLFSLKGWMDFRAVAVELSSGNAYVNGAARDMKEFMLGNLAKCSSIQEETN